MNSRFRTAMATAAVSLSAIGVMAVSASPASAGQTGQTGSATCFGYTGNFNSGGAYFVDWVYGPDECFGVAPSGTIWHTWSGAGSWKEMPGDGRAANVVAAFESLRGQVRQGRDGVRELLLQLRRLRDQHVGRLVPDVHEPLLSPFRPVHDRFAP